MEKFVLKNFDIRAFMRDYWQQKPLLIKNGLENFETLVSPEELAGLACEEGIESRIIEGPFPDGSWSTKNGPFSDQTFASLPEKNLTLLVQEVDKILPEVAEMRDFFSFLPSWRFDDVMISYAEDGGSVGPHLDNYDVFLLQAYGQRKWQIGDRALSKEEENLIPDCPVRVLESFDCQDTNILDVGDILYLPPRFAHHGVSIGRGMTYSFGFRSPSVIQMLTARAEQSLRQADESLRFCDPNRPISKSKAEILEEDMNRACDQMKEYIDSLRKESGWFGKLVTQNPNALYWEDLDDYQTMSIENVKAKLAGTQPIALSKNHDVRWAFYATESEILVYIHGEKFSRPLEELPLIKWLTEKSFFTCADWRSESLKYIEAQNWLIDLIYKGAFFFVEESFEDE